MTDEGWAAVRQIGIWFAVVLVAWMVLVWIVGRYR